MTTALDTNVIVSLWDPSEQLSLTALSALEESHEAGGLIVSPPVYTELMAAPGRDEAFLSEFFGDTGIRVDWQLEPEIWLAAGRAFGDYAGRRRKDKTGGPRRILADFLIGAHAMRRADRLLTIDDRFYRSAFPKLQVQGL